jgi:protease-4
MRFYDYVRNIFLIFVLVQIAPIFIENIRKQYRKYVEQVTHVGVVPIKGVIYQSDPYNKILRSYFKDKSIKAILIKMDCPGGAAGSSQAIFNEIEYLKKEYPKPIITLVENMCTSGGYYIAAATDHIVAPGSAIVGSIGTSIPYLFKIKGFFELLKIRNESIKAGHYKDMTNPFVDMSAEDRVLLQSLLDDSYQQFVRDVATKRNLLPTTATAWADGKIFTAEQGKLLGLIDTIGSAHNAVAIIKEKALIEGEIEWVSKKEPSVLARFFGSDDDTESESLFARMVHLTAQHLLSLLYM